MGKSFKTIGVKIYSFGLGGRFLFASVMADKVGVCLFSLGSDISVNTPQTDSFSTCTEGVSCLLQYLASLLDLEVILFIGAG